MTAPSLPDAQWFWENEPCRAACPVHTDAGAYVVAIAEGRIEDAYRYAREHNPFASICGRVCAAPCERSCRRGVIDAPVSIRALKRYATEHFGVESFEAGVRWHEAHGPLPAPTGKSVGIVGGGPAGLSAAHDLRVKGHAVTLYESGPVLGGMMVQGIPEYRLPRELIARETGAVVEMGVDVKLGHRVGRDSTATELLERHDAVFVAVGAGLGRDLDLPGRDLDGVVVAVEFLLNVNRGYTVGLGEKVVVVGGGNVAFDAARTALRAATSADGTSGDSAPGGPAPTDDDSRRLALTTTLDVARAARRAGVKSVTVCALESPEEIPADPEEIAAAEAEGIVIKYRTAPHRFLGDGSVRALQTLDVKSVFDANHRFAPVLVDGSEKEIEADTVIVAIGQRSDLEPFAAFALDTTRQGTIAIDATTLGTSNPRVWAGGDVAKGPRNLIDAIADGQRAAASIDAYLSGRLTSGRPEPTPHSVRIELTARPGYRRLATQYDAIPRNHVPMVETQRRTGFAEVELGFGHREAQLEGLRCLRCFDNVILEPSKCVLCGLCVDVCPTDCITIARADVIGLGTADQSVLLLDEDRCIRCGLCVNRCPPGALTMDHAKEPSRA